MSVFIIIKRKNVSSSNQYLLETSTVKMPSGAAYSFKTKKICRGPY